MYLEFCILYFPVKNNCALAKNNNLNLLRINEKVKTTWKYRIRPNSFCPFAYCKSASIYSLSRELWRQLPEFSISSSPINSNNFHHYKGETSKLDTRVIILSPAGCIHLLACLCSKTFLCGDKDPLWSLAISLGA